MLSLEHTAEDLATAVGNADSADQAKFLNAFAACVWTFWPKQCSYIADDLDDEQKLRLKSVLETLCEYL